MEEGGGEGDDDGKEQERENRLTRKEKKSKKNLERLAAAVRRKGWELDCVVPVPDGSRPAAIQISAELGLPYREGYEFCFVLFSFFSLHFSSSFFHRYLLLFSSSFIFKIIINANVKLRDTIHRV